MHYDLVLTPAGRLRLSEGEAEQIGKTVANLRKKMNMTKAQFARILEVSPATINNWEKSEGPLNLRARTQKAWEKVSKPKEN
jgi:DNA-binding transcriptional regulator YiaG